MTSGRSSTRRAFAAGKQGPSRHRLAFPALLLAALPLAAEGSAWTRAPGSVFLSGVSSYYESGGEHPYEEAVASTYGEVGILSWMTAGGAIEHKQPLGENALLGAQTTVSAFARARLREGAAGDPLSVQFAVQKPFEERSGESLERRSAEPAVEGRLLYGRGFATALGAGWVDLQGGYRARFDAAADEIRVDLTAGLRPAPRWLVMLQSFNTFGLGDPELVGDRLGEDYDVHKIAPSVGYDLGSATLLVGAEREIAGRNLGALGTRWRLAIWREF